MFSKEEAKQKLSELIEKFQKNSRKDNLSETETREYIRKLFEILGWDFLDGVEVTQEEQVSRGFVDYGFRLNNVPVMFVEAKRTSANLQEERFVHQAIDYAWHKATTWAILTNFNRIRVFNSYIKEGTLASQLFDLNINEYLDKFDSLWLLSKEGFENKEIDKLAEQWGKKAKEKPVEKQLFEDLNKWREVLAKYIKKDYEDKYSAVEIDEMIQLLLDRLILIRKFEDEGLEPRRLEEIYNVWLSSQKDLWFHLKNYFAQLDNVYNSKIFSEHELDNIKIEDYPLKIILPELYRSRDKTIRYNFSFIDADVLGNVYEQYLGYLLKTTTKRAKGEKSKTKRKKQGIYYTPRYIVNYIVKNTLGEKLKECKTWQDVEKIKVLDPACGSGSFLIRAFDEIYDWYEKKGLAKQAYLADETSHKAFETVKDRIIKNNLFGVDLDGKAVEIAQLNLLIKTADKKHKLPTLHENIKEGNSLIEAENIAGEKAFSWKKEFESIMKNGGFDVILGNPPYIRVDNLIEKEKDYFKKNFASSQGKYDIYYLFVEGVFKWLKTQGVCGFIIPNKFCAASSAKNLRETILANSTSCAIISVSNLGVFKDAANYPVILFLTKGKNNNKIRVGTVLKDNELLNNNFASYVITKEDLQILPAKIFPINITQKKFDLTIKLLAKNERLEKFLKISEGLRIPKDLESVSTTDFEILKQFQFNKWSPIKKDKFISKENLTKILDYKSNRHQSILKDKIIIAEDALILTATLDENKGVPQGGVYFGVLNDNKVPLKCLLGIMNSKLVSFVYKVLFGGMHMGGGYLRFRSKFLEQLPLKVPSKSQQQLLVTLVDKMLSLNKKLYKFGEKQTNERKNVEEKIKRTDKEIDELVYKLYEITKEEEKIIENSLLGN